MDLHSLALCNPAFLGKHFKQRFSDVIYTAQIEGRQGYLYLVAEHQSTPHRLMPVRLLHYQTHILLQHLDQHPSLSTLPMVYGLVFYHGKETPYPYATQIKDCFDDPEFARQTLLQGFQLVDIGQLSDAQIQCHQSVAVMEMLQKHYRNKNLLE